MSSFDKKTSAGVASIDSTSPAGSTSIGAPDNMENDLFPLSHSALPISFTTTTTTDARVLPLDSELRSTLHATS